MISAPSMKLESSDASKRAALAISLGRSEPPGWNRPLQPALCRFDYVDGHAGRLPDRRCRRAGAEHIHADAALDESRREAPRQRAHSGFRSSVGSEPLQAPAE